MKFYNSLTAIKQIVLIINLFAVAAFFVRAVFFPLSTISNSEMILFQLNLASVFMILK